MGVTAQQLATRKLSARHGSAILWTANVWVLLTVCIGAFAVDLGKYMYMRAAMRDAIDGAALAASAALESGLDPTAAAIAIVNANNRGMLSMDATKVVVTSGTWNPQFKSFTANAFPANAVQVTSTQNYNGGIFSRPKSTISASSIAHFMQRDIVLVLDFSGSMNEGVKAPSLRAAVNDFADVVEAVGKGKDRVELVRYSDYPSVPISFSSDMAFLKLRVGFEMFNGATNIGDALKMGIDQMQAFGRPGSEKMIVLLTDGLANRPLGVDPQQYVRDQALRAKALGYPVFTVSFGTDADQSLMQYVADVTESEHYHIDDATAGTNSELRTTFRELAAARSSHFVR